MRRAAKVDENQKELVSQLRHHGCSVAVTSGVGVGFPDIVVGYKGQNFLFEVKDPAKPPSARKLTNDQEEFHWKWRGQIDVIETADEAIEIMGMM